MIALQPISAIWRVGVQIEMLLIEAGIKNGGIHRPPRKANGRYIKLANAGAALPDDKNPNEIPFTLCEMYRLLSSKPVLIAYLLTVGLCVVAGPFSTFENLSVLARIPYWLLVIGGCFIIAIGSQVVVSQNLYICQWNALSKIGLYSLANGFAIAVFVYLVNRLVWGDIPTLPRFYNYLAMTIPISIAISAGFHYFSRHKKRNINEDNNEKSVAFFDRLPRHLGTDLISVSVSDHYIVATTAKGSHMILMRFADALRELTNYDGIQIHRSHWVATDAIEKTNAAGGKLVITLTNGESFQVSRSRMGDVKANLKM